MTGYNGPALRAVFGDRAAPSEPAPAAAHEHGRDELLIYARRIYERLCELVELDSGQVLAIPKRHVFTSSRVRHRFEVTQGDTFHALKVDNYSATLPLYVGFGGDSGQPGQWDEIVPPLTGRIFARPFDEVSIGLDPNAAATALATTPLVVPVTYYSRYIAPNTYDLALGPGGLEATVTDGGLVPVAPSQVLVVDQHAGGRALTVPAGARIARIENQGAGTVRWTDDGSDPAVNGSLLVASERLWYTGALAALRFYDVPGTGQTVYAQFYE